MGYTSRAEKALMSDACAVLSLYKDAAQRWNCQNLAQQEVADTGFMYARPVGFNSFVV